MAKTVTATEAKNRLGALMNEVIESNEPVIIELRGRPKIAMITRKRLEAIEELERQQRHAQALANLNEIARKYDGRNDDLTEEEAMELAVEVTREVRREMRESGERRSPIVAISVALIRFPHHPLRQFPAHADDQPSQFSIHPDNPSPVKRRGGLDWCSRPSKFAEPENQGGNRS